jgi:DNA-binding CsgD family transcriptional regulator
LAVINQHLSNLYSCFEKLERSAEGGISDTELLELFPQLSRREAQVAALLYSGLTASEIASKLFISVRTAEWHLEQLYSKLEVRSKREALSILARRPSL